MQSGLQPPDLDTTGAQRQIGALEQTAQSVLQSTRELLGTTDASFSSGTRATRPGSGASGDRFFADDLNWLYMYSGTAWIIISGLKSGTNATRAAFAPDTTDNGAYWWATDTGKLWEVSGGAWVDRFVDIAVTTGFKVGTDYVVKARGAAVVDVASADASDLATAITLANEMKAQLNALLARVRAATGHGLIA